MFVITTDAEPSVVSTTTPIRTALPIAATAEAAVMPSTQSPGVSDRRRARSRRSSPM